MNWQLGLLWVNRYTGGPGGKAGHVGYAAESGSKLG
jgi:hypothetical protein